MTNNTNSFFSKARSAEVVYEEKSDTPLGMIHSLEEAAHAANVGGVWWGASTPRSRRLLGVAESLKRKEHAHYMSARQARLRNP